MIKDPLYVIAVISNPIRYRIRYLLYLAFAKYMKDSGAHLITVEMAYGNRPFAVTDADNPDHIQVRSAHELWHKENLIRIGMSRLPATAKYVAWIDADVTFARPDWVQETLQQLQHYDWIQPWSFAQDLGPKYEPIGSLHQGFMYAYYNDPTFNKGKRRFGYYGSGHPGFAWAARVDAINKVGGLIDYALVGGADRHMACGLIGVLHQSGPYAQANINQLENRFKQKLLLWQERAKALKKNVGYVDGLILHSFHGKKADRQYGNRWKIYTDCGYDPDLDLVKDSQGLYQLTDRNIELRDRLRCFLRNRNEDSIDL